ncbi:transcrption init factor TFIIIB 70K sub [Ecytonucleospora hepatopenaei]|uniref:B-related factor 1 n=1 Tax=Ecytonucleospora hepatopenaei TaxID=646526 RepID=A0A1W0E383_9MICR|nr:transcrption init factor TFIIIB 70K sub [Ecytonucleospora hepatopenaei]
MSKVCINCNSNELTTDTSRGIICCEECGMIQEENLIVNTIQFESTNNKSTMHGKVVNVENKNVGTQYVDSCYYIKNTIKNITIKLSLTNTHADIAFRWYKLCLANNLTKGKSILHTLSACIYIACRQTNSPHLLIDFSNVLQIDMYQIGKIYLRIRNTFKIENQVEDTYLLYLHRFVDQLKFNTNTNNSLNNNILNNNILNNNNLNNNNILNNNNNILNNNKCTPKDVILLSTRILNRMKKDWIIEGRKPNNACGAAILLASRILGDPREVHEVARVVHAAPATLTKRLKEFASTQTAKMDINEFNTEWLDEEAAPPVLRQFKTIRSNNNNIKDNNNILYSNNIKENNIKDIENNTNLYNTNTNNTNNTKDIFINELNNTLNNKNIINNDNNKNIINNDNIINNNILDGDNDSSFINDMILPSDEVATKTAIWEEMYGTYVKEAENKRKSKASTATGVTRKKTKKKHNFATVEEAYKSLDKKVSSKLNYTALSGLFQK